MCAIYAQYFNKMYVGKYIFRCCFLNENTKSVDITRLVTVTPFRNEGDKNSPGQVCSPIRFRKISIVWMLFLSSQGEFKRLFMLKEVHVTEHFSARFWNLDPMELPLSIVVSSSVNLIWECRKQWPDRNNLCQLFRWFNTIRTLSEARRWEPNCWKLKTAYRNWTRTWQTISHESPQV